MATQLTQLTLATQATQAAQAAQAPPGANPTDRSVKKDQFDQMRLY